MIWVFLIIATLLLIGPFRKGFVLSWRTVLPLTGGGIVGFILAAMFASLGGPAWLMFFGPITGALMIGATGRQWFYENFPPGKE